jgi:hypothetical protein
MHILVCATEWIKEKRNGRDVSGRGFIPYSPHLWYNIG